MSLDAMQAKGAGIRSPLPVGSMRQLTVTVRQGWARICLAKEVMWTARSRRRRHSHAPGAAGRVSEEACSGAFKASH